MTARKPPAKKAPASALARQAEAGNGYVTIEQCGVELRIPVGDKVPFSATLRFMDLNDDLTPLGEGENGNLAGTKILLGDEQWKTFLATGPSVGDFNAIGDRLQELSGN